MSRDLDRLVVGRWGSVRPGGSGVAWVVQDAEGLIVGPVAEFLRDFAARGNSAGSVRSYAYVLLRWWRWLAAVGVDWDRATAAEVRDLVLWLQLHPKPRRSARTLSADLVGTVNPKTGKQYLDDHYAAHPKWWLSGLHLVDLDTDGKLDLFLSGHGRGPALASL